MKLVNILFLLFFTFIFSSCKREKVIEKEKVNNNNDIIKKEFKRSKYFDEDRIKDAKYAVKYKGDKASYAELELYYVYNDLKKEEIIPYTLIMVEKYHKYEYASTAFMNLLEFYTDAKFTYDGTYISLLPYLKNFKKLNLDQKNYLIYFLKTGVKNENLGCVRYLEILNREGIGISRNIKMADSLKKKVIQLEYKKHLRVKK
ncbi:hypothetical protein SGQ83_01575 [Flavobacterium sp. Fl-318]|uniref:Lipoprotein n=1 Tax=Flavobacterium cupriresistens TaxID=2893885 RepID=A0ABU4RBW8_9FLAO|nr:MULTISPECIES: hypothetical protein [unclassified Flavobacterium]MDX6188026.1 hypothetical protein [Flavobacterium sp. Fl-318]UFH42054.1 hypothetical protein LNP23_19875 [Flavobacterium sp. F-323]